MDKKYFIAQKIRKIVKEGVRRNTHAPVSKKNPRRKVKNRMAIAIAESLWQNRKRQ
jgi:hypothetical protein